MHVTGLQYKSYINTKIKLLGRFLSINIILNLRFNLGVQCVVVFVCAPNAKKKQLILDQDVKKPVKLHQNH